MNKPDHFADQVPHSLTILSPFKPEELLCTLTILVNKDTRAVELSAVPHTVLQKEGICIDLLQLAIQRIKQIHKGRAQSEIVLPQ